MKQQSHRRGGCAWSLAVVVAALVPAAFPAFADQVEMQNGDRYVGRVVSLNSDTLVVQSDLLGTVRLPRAKVALVAFGAAATNLTVFAAKARETAQVATATAPANSGATPNSLVGQLNANSNLIERIQKQFLTGADSEAQDKFGELLSGLLTGKLTVEDIRAQAKATADQVRAAREDLGDENGWVVDGYLAILDRFLRNTPPPAGWATNAAPPKPKLKESLEAP